MNQHPVLSESLSIPDGVEIELDKLWSDLCDEFLDHKYAGRTHGHRKTYDAGCRGPACMRASRVWGRKRTQAVPSIKSRYLDEVVAEWQVEIQIRLEEARKRLLEQVRNPA